MDRSVPPLIATVQNRGTRARRGESRNGLLVTSRPAAYETSQVAASRDDLDARERVDKRHERNRHDYEQCADETRDIRNPNP